MEKTNLFIILTLLNVSYIFLSSCNQKDDESGGKQRVNSLEMLINEKIWIPSTDKNNKCISTFYAEYSRFGISGEELPVYTIKAYKDPQLKGDRESENVFVLQLLVTKQEGVYTLQGSYKEDFTSYAHFIRNRADGSSVRYVNKQVGNSFIIHVEQFIPIEGSSIVGVKGTFNGTLFNEENPLDSLVIKNGNYSFTKLNRFNFDQCLE